MNKDSENSRTPGSEGKSNKFLPNNRYFTICIYALIVITLGTLIIRIIMTPYAVTDGLKKILNMLMPFLMGVLIALILNPIINRFYQIMVGPLKLKQKKLCKAVAAVLAYMLVLGLILICIIFVVPQIITSLTELVNSLPQLYQLTYNFFNTLQERFPNTDVSEIQKMVNDILPTIISTLRNFASNIVPAVYTAAVSIVTWVVNALIAIIVSAYILVDKKNLKRTLKIVLYSFVPNDFISDVIEILKECNSIFTQFIVGKAIDSMIIGVLCFICMNIFQLDYSLLISFIVGITNMIPYFGPFIGAVPGILVLLMISPLKSFGFLILILILQQFDGLYLGPKIMGDTVGLKPLWIIISISLGGSIAGVLGMFLSVPLCAILAYLLKRLLNYRLHKKNLHMEDIH